MKPENEIKKIEESKNKFIKFKTESESLKNYFKKLDFEEWTIEFECSVMLNTLTKIFFLFSDIITYRLTLIWSMNLEHKNILQQLRSLVFDKVSKINLYLSEFINSINIFFPKEECIKKILNNRYEIDEIDEDFSNFMIRLFYRGLRMESELKEIIKLFQILDEELKNMNLNQESFIPLDLYTIQIMSF